MMKLIAIIAVFTALAFSIVYSDETRPNIIFIFTDDWGWNDVSYHGGTHLETDFIDTLANDGLILSQHYVLPTCTPSRAALLTGRYPSNIGMQHSTIAPGDIFGVPLDEQFIGEELQSQGYTTHMIGKWHLGFCAWEYTPLNRGFDSFSGFYLGAESYSSHNRSVGDIDGFDLRRNNDIVEDADGIYSTYWHYSELSDLMTQLQGQNDPFFIYLAWQNSHNPPEAPKSYLKKYKEVAKGARWFFMGQTAVLDDVMEDFIEELKEKNLWDNTLIVFTSDNGAQKDSGDNAPLRGAKSTCWEGAVRVPAFVTGGYLPDSMRGKTTNEMIHITDWYSTFTSLATTNENSNKQIKTETDGFDVSSVILNGESTKREEFLINVDKVNCNLEVCGALRYKNYKLIIGGSGITSSTSSKSDCFWTRDYMSDELNKNGKLSINECGIVPSDVNTESCNCMTELCLFDLSNDPCEYYDLSLNNEYKELIDTMYTKLKEYYNSQLHPWKDIYSTDYDNANPKLFDNYWTPWLTKEQVIKKQDAQYTIFEAKIYGINTQTKTKKLNISFNLNNDILNNSSVWIIMTFVLIAIMFTFIAYRAKRRFEKYFNNNNKNIIPKSNVEKNPLLQSNNKNNNMYNSVESN